MKTHVALKTARQLFQRVNRIYAVRANVTVASGVHIGPGSVVWASQALSIGPNVYIGKRCTIEVDGSIGRDTVIANNVGIVGRHDHDIHAIGVPIAQAPWIGDPEIIAHGGVTIGSDVWVGYGAIILGPIDVGRGAVIGAGAVVTKNVPPYTIVAGNPAVLIGQRFSLEDRAIHETMLDRQATASPNSDPPSFLTTRLKHAHGAPFRWGRVDR